MQIKPLIKFFLKVPAGTSRAISVDSGYFISYAEGLPELRRGAHQ